MRVLGCDPGTLFGWAYSDTEAGVWNLQPNRFEGQGMRNIKLRTELDKFEGRVDLLAYEEVNFSKSVIASQVYGGLVAVIQMWCEEHGVPYMGVPTATVKKYATDKGNANKAMMMAAAIERWDLDSVKEDEADARFIRAYAVSVHGRNRSS